MLHFGARVTLQAPSGGLLVRRRRGLLQANAQPGDAETVFTLVDPEEPASAAAISLKQDVALRSEGGTYLTGRRDGLLRASVATIGSWQRWSFRSPADPDAEGPVDETAPLALRRKGYLAPESDGEVYADRVWPRDAFTWTLQQVGGVQLGRPHTSPRGSIHMPHTLLAQRFELSQAVRVTHLGAVGFEDGGQLRMALYADEAGSPGALLGHAPAAPIDDGAQAAALERPVDVPAGPVFVGVLVDQLARLAHDDGHSTDTWHRAQSFDGDMPSHFGGHAASSTPALSIYLVGER